MPKPAEQDAVDQYALIPLRLLDEPTVPERETMDERELAELALNLREVGLIQPLTVKRMGDRFEVTAGHRRLLACRIAPLDPVPCIIRAVGNIDPLAVLVAENAFREEVNAIEEARFYKRILELQCGNDVDVLCDKIRRNRGFVEDRLLLLQGYPPVVEALHQRKISISVARELNKVKHANQAMVFLDSAILQGATARTVANWRKDFEIEQDFTVTQRDAASTASDGAPVVYPFQQLCFFCNDASDSHLMQTVHFHAPCKRMVQKALGLTDEVNGVTTH